MNEVPLEFVLTKFRPDQRRFRQQELEMECIVRVQVKLPAEAKYVVNLDELEKAKDETIAPVLTVEGLRFITDLFDTVFQNATQDLAISESGELENEEWKEEKPTNSAAKKPQAKEEDWEEAWEEQKKKPEEVSWDEDDENWE